MVNQFQFSRLPLIYFGQGNIKLLPGLVRRYGTVIILVTDNKSFINSPYAVELFDIFRKMEIQYLHINVPGEPTPEMIDRAVEKFNNSPVDAVVSIGGGSVIDAGKAISAMMYKQEPVKDYLEGVGTKEHPGTKLPFIALPTTSGTGSEATKNSVISQVGKDGFKKSLRHENFVPDIAIVDPELTFSCPREITSASGMDCFTQLTESFLSDKASIYTDALAWEGLKAIKTSLLQSYESGNDLRARTGMSFAALTSGICLANAGLGVVHGFASSIGGRYNIPHGVICGTLMAPANAVIIREMESSNKNPGALDKYLRLGRLFIDAEGKSDNFYINGFIQYIQELTDKLKLPLLHQFGVDENELEEICRLTEIKNNPVKLNTETLFEIIMKRI